MRIASIVGARPNFIKMAAIFEAISRRGLEHLIIHTGQHYDYEMSTIFFKEMAIPEPNYNLEVGSDRQGSQLGEVIKRCEETLLDERPDIVLVYGDVNSTLGGALAARKNLFKLGHVEAGLRSFERDMQEEMNRVLTDHLSDYLFCPTKTAMANLERENLTARSYLTGDVMVSVLRRFMSSGKDDVLSRLGINKRAYVLFTLHRAENVDSPKRLKMIVEAVAKISEDSSVVFPAHPRTTRSLDMFGLTKCLAPNTKVIKPLGYSDFLALERNAKVILTDSGGVQKEAYLLGVPCVTLRERTEWTETVDDGWNKLVACNQKEITSAVRDFKPTSPQSNRFGLGDAPDKIIDILIERR